ncbi:hypothetical protein [Halorussus caseinilyticus]|uniref:Uncharacterized protein n=1 Tax=Halorussus caseinilyticus TaxID=3034025 RepID=A0ABD5WT45_9EURY|nr:hypothetical protein [Halorussus sp. DT72]
MYFIVWVSDYGKDGRRVRFARPILSRFTPTTSAVPTTIPPSASSARRREQAEEPSKKRPALLRGDDGFSVELLSSAVADGDCARDKTVD